jgi:hypothetical protein
VAWDCMTTNMGAPALERRYEFNWLEGGRTNTRKILVGLRTTPS